MSLVNDLLIVHDKRAELPDRYRPVVNFYFLVHDAMVLVYHRGIKNPYPVVIAFYIHIGYLVSLGEHLLFRFENLLLYFDFDLWIYRKVYVSNRLMKIVVEFFFVLKLWFDFFNEKKKNLQKKTEIHLLDTLGKVSIL